MDERGDSVVRKRWAIAVVVGAVVVGVVAFLLAHLSGDDAPGPNALPLVSGAHVIGSAVGGNGIDNTQEGQYRYEFVGSSTMSGDGLACAEIRFLLARRWTPVPSDSPSYSRTGRCRLIARGRQNGEWWASYGGLSAPDKSISAFVSVDYGSSGLKADAFGLPIEFSQEALTDADARGVVSIELHYG